MKKHRVRAAPFVLVPLEGAPGRHINSTEPQWVFLTPYYRRRIDDGDLVLDPASLRATRGGTELQLSPMLQFGANYAF